MARNLLQAIDFVVLPANTELTLRELKAMNPVALSIC